MRRLNALVVLLLLSALLAGCASSAIEMAPEQPDRPWTPATTSAGEIIPDEKPPPLQPRSDTFVLPSNTALAELPPPLELDRDKVYSLPELIDIAQSSNPSTRRAWNAAKEAALAAGIAKTTYLPRITATAVGGWQMLQSTPAVETGRGTISSVSVQWLLFDFGQRAAVAEAASQGSVIANIGFTAAHQQLIHEVSLAFYANSAARARVGNVSQSLKNAQYVEIAADERMKKGIGTVVEVAQAHQATAQARLGLVQAQGMAQNAYLGLLSAMGVSPRTEIRVADVSDRKLTPALADSVDRVISEFSSGDRTFSPPMRPKKRASPTLSPPKPISCRRCSSRAPALTTAELLTSLGSQESAISRRSRIFREEGMAPPSWPGSRSLFTTLASVTRS